MDDLAKERQFATTRWSLVVQAGGISDSHKLKALQTLCEMYWQPVYYYLRADQKTPEEAMDIVQGFMGWLLERANLSGASPDKGRFRSYLLGALKHYLYDQKKKCAAEKRGGKSVIQSLNVDHAERTFLSMKADRQTPETIYRKQWALTLLKQVLEELRTSYEKTERLELFEAIKPALTDELEKSYSEVAKELGTTESSIKTAVYRLKKNYRSTLLAHVAETIDGNTTVKEEIRALLDALSSDGS